MVRRVPGRPRHTEALVHGLRHTFATELANADVSVYPLMKLLAHESMVTSQRYVTAAGTEARTAAAQTRSTTCQRNNARLQQRPHRAPRSRLTRFVDS